MESNDFSKYIGPEHLEIVDHMDHDWLRLQRKLNHPRLHLQFLTLLGPSII
ncbi:hypothetical protein HYC85_028114 [Camellia sinensis]|uniref:Uncharacterized protein n=1 Tax=Camellia sinensis TaxID=4442 RepID=A0A7J7FU72_CAMSI|nr:hypothetical protein HYC85_028114 [Camellia sinensis]